MLFKEHQVYKYAVAWIISVTTTVDSETLTKFTSKIFNKPNFEILMWDFLR